MQIFHFNLFMYLFILVWTCGFLAHAMNYCCRRAQTETERPPSFWEASLLSKTAATQLTHVQRLSTKKKGLQKSGAGEGVQLVPYIITCYFIGCFNL
jgi:hypothetical protein